MKRFVVGLMLAAMAAIGFGGATAFAAEGNREETNFQVVYDSPPNHNVCSGVHVVDKHTLPGSMDRETCIVSGDMTGFHHVTDKSDPKLGTLTVPGCIGAAALGIMDPYGVQGWVSDYFYLVEPRHLCVLAYKWKIVQTDNHNGTFTWRVTAYFPAA